MRELPDELANILKDSLRGARYLVRRGTRMGQTGVVFAPGMPEIARFADTVLTATELTATALLRHTPAFADAASAREMCLAVLTETDAGRQRRQFVSLHYRLIDAVLRHLGVENRFISEHEIAAGYDLLQRRQRRVLAAARHARPHAFWVAAAATLATRHPLREIDLPRRAGPRTALLEQSPTQYCLLIVALTAAILSNSPLAVEEGLAACIESAAAVVTARADEFLGQFARTDRVDRLARAFEAVLPFLP